MVFDELIGSFVKSEAKKKNTASRCRWTAAATEKASVAPQGSDLKFS